MSLPTKAQVAAQKPSAEVALAIAALPKISKASRSTARTDFQFDDGSGLVLTSANGGKVLRTVTPPPSGYPASELPL